MIPALQPVLEAGPIFLLILALLLLCAAAAFALGACAGWFQWRFLANRVIAALDRENQSLRDQILGGDTIPTQRT